MEKKCFFILQIVLTIILFSCKKTNKEMISSTPYDDSKQLESIAASESVSDTEWLSTSDKLPVIPVIIKASENFSDTEWKGTGLYPEGLIYYPEGPIAINYYPEGVCSLHNKKMHIGRRRISYSCVFRGNYRHEYYQYKETYFINCYNPNPIQLDYYFALSLGGYKDYGYHYVCDECTKERDKYVKMLSLKYKITSEELAILF